MSPAMAFSLVLFKGLLARNELTTLFWCHIDQVKNTKKKKICRCFSISSTIVPQITSSFRRINVQGKQGKQLILAKIVRFIPQENAKER